MEICQAELLFVVHIQRVNAAYPVSPGREGKINRFVDCGRKNVTKVIVGVLADEVHSAWRSHKSRLLTIQLVKFLVDCFQVIHKDFKMRSLGSTDTM